MRDGFHRGTSCFLVLGAFSLVGQTVLFRELYVLFAGNELVLGVMLSSWMIWVSAGSGASGRRVGPRRSGSFGALLVLGALLLLGSVAALRLASPLVVQVQGEIAGFRRMALVCFVATMPCGILAGYLFGLGSEMSRAGGMPSHLAGSRVYTWEAMGSGVTGLLLGYFVLSALGSLRTAVLFLVLTASLAFALGAGKRMRRTTVAALALLPVLAFTVSMHLQDKLDRALESARLPGYELVGSTESPYGRTDLAVREGQKTLFYNGTVKAVKPDRATAEEKIHLPILAHGGPSRILLLGGAEGDALDELARHEPDEVVYVELDGRAMGLAVSGGLLKIRPWIRVVTGDPRAFLASTKDSYDLIIVGMGEPLSLQLNRFYTVEFFKSAASRLRNSGVLALNLPGSENYLAPAKKRFLASILSALEEVFPSVLVLLGGRVHMIAFKKSESAVTAEEIVSRLEKSGLELYYLMPLTLRFRFSETRMEEAAGLFNLEREVAVNRDFNFSGYLYDLLQWNSRLKLGLPDSASRLVGRRGWVFASALAGLALLYLLAMIVAPGSRAGRTALSSITIVGMTAMGGDLAIITAFQVVCGSMYRWLAALSGLFMAGAALGCAAAVRSGEDSRRNAAASGREDGGSGIPYDGAVGSSLAKVHIGMGAVLVSVVLFLEAYERGWLAVTFMQAAFGLLSLGLGTAAGAGYLVACRLAGDSPGIAARVYAFDLIGGFLGASLFAAIILPMSGMYYAILLLAMLNGLAAACHFLPASFSFSPKTTAEKA